MPARFHRALVGPALFAAQPPADREGPAKQRDADQDDEIAHAAALIGRVAACRHLGRRPAGARPGRHTARADRGQGRLDRRADRAGPPLQRRRWVSSPPACPRSPASSRSACRVRVEVDPGDERHRGELDVLAAAGELVRRRRGPAPPLTRGRARYRHTCPALERAHDRGAVDRGAAAAPTTPGSPGRPARPAAPASRLTRRPGCRRHADHPTGAPSATRGRRSRATARATRRRDAPPGSARSNRINAT